MVVSFHPCFVGDVNRLCAGRDPGPEDRAAIQAADAVILPQGCRRPLYEMARRHGRRVFPNYDARFAYPGKTGQIRLFRRFEVAHPESLLFADVQECLAAFGRRPVMAFPLVFKFDWGGEGQGVHRFDRADALCRFLQAHRREPPSSCLVQEFIPGAERTLRVAVVGRSFRSYWRVAETPRGFYANLARGGAIDPDADWKLQSVGMAAVRGFCEKSGIDLAGFDLVFSDVSAHKRPVFLEINYYFGRRGLGGSERFYRLLEEQIRIWLEEGGRR
jgi:ribosomal protein S6--L-glutamate ligase